MYICLYHLFFCYSTPSESLKQGNFKNGQTAQIYKFQEKNPDIAANEAIFKNFLEQKYLSSNNLDKEKTNQEIIKEQKKDIYDYLVIFNYNFLDYILTLTCFCFDNIGQSIKKQKWHSLL
ncbi:hypothetical protein EDEG_00181 [Edhazardia aedis USNM 41457]|uniref:Uncharacterized protein n=1 Tax=Edhazardia aedis (strain USNM 41457) TaxID=1003232 RepID=J8ZVL3_EDHAE|nr:hypothetical protein EDEG_00181 [Edhazardia aedis USNM 41457]|eukprot:EJW03693.1 hypothetical protein EDEG_00181 [Edhazardia aedis USNM 41457]